MQSIIKILNFYIILLSTHFYKLFPIKYIPNKTGLQPLSRPVEQIHWFFLIGLKKMQKTVQISLKNTENQQKKVEYGQDKVFQ